MGGSSKGAAAVELASLAAAESCVSNFVLQGATVKRIPNLVRSVTCSL